MGKQNKMPSFDGKSFGAYMKDSFGTERDYHMGRPGETISPSARDRYNQDFAIYAATGRGRAGIMNSGASAGMSPAEVATYAQKAGIKNVNSDSDMKAIAEAYKAEKLGGDNAAAIEDLKKKLMKQAEEKKEKPPEKEWTGDKEYDYSDRVQAAKDRLDSGMYKLSAFDYGNKDSSDTGRLFNYGASRESPTTDFKLNNVQAPTKNTKKEATGTYLQSYKRDLADAGKLSERFASNINNAVDEVLKNNRF